MSGEKQHLRHSQIRQRLERGETLSITQLAQEFAVTPKTIQRDFKKLREAYPDIVRAEDGRSFLLRRSRASGDLEMAAQVLESLSREIGHDFYLKAQPALRTIRRHAHSPFYVRMGMEDISTLFPLIETIEEAIEGQRYIAFSYRPNRQSSTIKSYRHIAPYKIVHFDGFWYLLTTYKGNYLKFYLREIRDLHLEKEQFIVDTTLLSKMERAHNVWFDPAIEPFEVRLLLEPAAAAHYRRQPMIGQRLAPQADGTTEMTVWITHKEEIFAQVRKWFPLIKILEPYELRKAFDQLVRRYTGND